MKVIELFGLFNAGKFTLIKWLVRRLSALGYRVHSIQVDRSVPAEFIETKNYFDREMLILVKTLSEIITVQDSSRADFVFVHRGFWDAIAFFEGLIRAKFISRRIAKIGIRLAEANTTRIDLAVLVEISPEISLGRSYLDPNIPRDLIRDISSLEALAGAYQALKSRLPEESLILDGTLPIEKNLEILLKTILSPCEPNPGIEILKELTFIDSS